MGLFSKKSAPQPSARPEYIEVGQIVPHGWTACIPFTWG